MKALLLVGSPRQRKSTSNSLGRYLLGMLKKGGIDAQTIQLYKSLRTEAKRKELALAIEHSDIIILAFPLYVDTLPAPVIEAMELVSKSRENLEVVKKQRFMAIVNSGFPEPDHSRVALANCKAFVSEAGMEWAGGLIIGGGEAIHGQALEDIKGMARKVIRALELTAEALAKSVSVPDEALGLTSKPLVPKGMYLFFGNRGWKSKAKKNGVRNRLYDAPYVKN